MSAIYLKSEKDFHFGKANGKFYGYCEIEHDGRRYVRYLTEYGWVKTNPFYGTKKQIKDLAQCYFNALIPPVTNDEIKS